jgi:hypothetical protein
VAPVEVGGADHFGVHPAENEQEQIHKLITGNATKNHIKKITTSLSNHPI